MSLDAARTSACATRTVKESLRFRRHENTGDRRGGFDWLQPCSAAAGDGRRGVEMRILVTAGKDFQGIG